MRGRSLADAPMATLCIDSDDTLTQWVTEAHNVWIWDPERLEGVCRDVGNGYSCSVSIFMGHHV